METDFLKGKTNLEQNLVEACAILSTPSSLHACLMLTLFSHTPSLLGQGSKPSKLTPGTLHSGQQCAPSLGCIPPKQLEAARFFLCLTSLPPT